MSDIDCDLCVPERHRSCVQPANTVVLRNRPIHYRCKAHRASTQTSGGNPLKKLIGGIVAILIGLGALTACSDASVVSQNISTDADNFKINRQIVFYNGITNTYIATVEGKCSVEDSMRKLAVVCKVGEGKYIKDFLGKSDNVTWFALQDGAASVSANHFKIVFKPETVIPNFEVR